MTNSIQNKKSNTSLNIKKRGSLFYKIFSAFELKRISKVITILIVIFLIIIGSVYFVGNYKTDNYQISNLKYVNKHKVSDILNTDLTSKTFLEINTNELEDKIKSQSNFIKEIKISKSLISGIIIDIVEYEPIIIINTIDGKKYFITKSDELIDYDTTENINEIPEFHYTGSDLKDSNLLNLANRAKSLADKLKGTVQGNFNFDNFGNLFILQEENKVIRFDLNENFFPLDDQIKLLHDAMSKQPEYSEIDVRFSYLLIK